MRKWWLAIGAVLVAGGLSWRMLRTNEPRPQSTPAASVAAVPSATPPTVGTLPAAASSAPTLASAVASAPLPATPPAEVLDLTTAQRAVDTQLALLRAGRDAEFRATFLPSVVLDAAAIAACKRRVEQVPVRPDWEMAESSTDATGHPVRRVSIFGKSMTGFHEVSGKWLADAPWCVPTGLP